MIVERPPFSQYSPRWGATVGTPGASLGCISLKRSVVVGAILDFVTSIHLKCCDNFVISSQGCERPSLINFALFPQGWTVCHLLPPRRRKLEADGRDDRKRRELLPDVEHPLQVRKRKLLNSRCAFNIFQDASFVAIKVPRGAILSTAQCVHWTVFFPFDRVRWDTLSNLKTVILLAP